MIHHMTDGTGIRRSEAGFSLMEAIVATVIATIAVVGLAHSFGLGRSFINRFETARAALGVAQKRLEIIHAGSDPLSNLATGILHLGPFEHGGHRVGSEEWNVTWYDDPATPDPRDLKLVTVRVFWSQGTISDTVTLTRLFLPN